MSKNYYPFHPKENSIWHKWFLAIINYTGYLQTLHILPISRWLKTTKPEHLQNKKTILINTMTEIKFLICSLQARMGLTNEVAEDTAGWADCCASHCLHTRVWARLPLGAGYSARWPPCSRQPICYTAHTSSSNNSYEGRILLGCREPFMSVCHRFLLMFMCMHLVAHTRWGALMRQYGYSMLF